MKSIMISIKPEWVAKILNGDKTIEIRKIKPKCELPCKVYIYCLQPKKWYADSPFTASSDELLWKQGKRIYSGKEDSLWNPKFRNYRILNGKVVAEFTLNKVTEHKRNFIDLEDNECYNFKVCDVKNAGFDTNALALCDFDNFVENYGKGKPLFAWHIDKLKIYNKPKNLSEFIPLKRAPHWCYVERP